MKITVLRFLMLLALPLTTLAADSDPKAAITASLEKILPQSKADQINPAPIPGLYEVLIGPRVVYMSADGRFLLQGNIYNIETGEDLTEAREATAKKAAVRGLSEENMIVFGNADAQHSITVFTDIDCGYCRKLHKEIESYLSENFRVRYLFFPRAGVGSDSYKKAISVWCADDRKQALTDAKAGKTIPEKTCRHPIDEHMKLAELMGVRGTPAIVLDDGRMLPGYVPAKKLKSYLTEAGTATTPHP